MTLITGDSVVVSPDGRGIRLVPGPGRERIPFIERRATGGGLSVIPADAQPLIARGALDRRLFDITGLTRQRLDDAARKDVPLIVTHTGTPDVRAGARTRLGGSGARLARSLSSVSGSVVRVPKGDAARFWTGITSTTAARRSLSAGIAKVWLDGRVEASLDHTTTQIGTPAAWQAGLTGKGVRVAVLDTGIDSGHPDLADAVIEGKDFTESGSFRDGHGHGTHVASIITGSGAASSGRYRGVAPDVDLLIGKVLDDGGGGYDSSIIAGMEWAVASGATVVNLSLGGCPTAGTDPLSQAVNALSERSGALFTIAAGNHPAYLCPESQDLVSTPAAADHALAVGSVTKQDELSSFSNVGPRVGDGAVKPEITAPGQAVVAARAEGAETGSPVGDHYAQMSGTSMAAPHVAGAAALLAQQHPGWKAAELRSALMASAKSNPALGVFQQGAGRVDVAAAIAQQVLTSPAVVSMGTVAWPHSDDQPQSRVVTYTNAGHATLSLDLTAAGAGPGGGSAPPGMFSVNPSRITLAAGESAPVTVTTDTGGSGPDGAYSGSVTAKNGSDVVARTPIGVVKEVESYNLRIDVLDRNGKRSETSVGLTGIGQPVPRDIPLSGRPITVRLPKGHYDLVAATFTDKEDATQATLAVRPELSLDRDTTIVLDSRRGRRVRAVVDSATAKPEGREIAWVSNGTLRTRLHGGNDPSGAAELYATPTRKVSSYPYTFGFMGALAEPDGTRGYLLYLTEPARIPDPALRVRDRDLAAVHSTLRGQNVPVVQSGTLTGEVLEPEGWVYRLGDYPIRRPGRRVDLYSAGAGLRWSTSVAMEGGHYEFRNGFERPGYLPGRTYRQLWNAAAIGPTAAPDYAFGRLWAAIAPFSTSSSGHHNGDDGAGTTARTTLTRNGVTVGDNNQPDGGAFPLPPGERATYVLATQATRAVGWSTLGTRIDAKWTFSAGPLQDGASLPVLDLRISGAFDLQNRAPADRPVQLHLRAERPRGAPPALAGLTVDASYDDGRTWQPLTVSPGSDGRYVATGPQPPAAASFVSLRATARDTDGNSVEQTSIRSYALKR